MTAGNVLKQYLKNNGIKQTSLAKATKTSSGWISQLVNGTHPITLETSEKISEVLETPPSFWSDIQIDYENGKFESVDAYLNQLRATTNISGILGESEISALLEYGNQKGFPNVRQHLDVFFIDEFRSDRFRKPFYSLLLDGYFQNEDQKIETSLDVGEELVVEPGEEVLLCSDERFQLGSNIFGTCHLAKGPLQSFFLIEWDQMLAPGESYDIRLKVTNRTTKKQTLLGGMPMMFVKLECATPHQIGSLANIEQSALRVVN